MNELEEVYKNADEAVKLLEEKATETDSSDANINLENEIQNARTCLEKLKDAMQKTTSNGQKMREGDSVILKMDPEKLDPKFLDGDLHHFSIGYIQDWDADDENDDVCMYVVE